MVHVVLASRFCARLSNVEHTDYLCYKIAVLVLGIFVVGKIVVSGVETQEHVVVAISLLTKSINCSRDEDARFDQLEPVGVVYVTVDSGWIIACGGDGLGRRLV